LAFDNSRGYGIIEHAFYDQHREEEAFMRSFLEFLTNFYWIALPETILQTLWHADWRRAKDRGLGGLIREAVASLLGTNTWPFFVPLHSGWDGAAIARLLSRHGVKMWGYGFAGGELFFRVRRSQAAWAQYVLLREGVPLQHRLFTEKATHEPQLGLYRKSSAKPQHQTTLADPTAAVGSLIDSLDDYVTSFADRIASRF
jgi:hypothetical protein